MFGELFVISLWIVLTFLAFYLHKRFKRAPNDQKHACVIVLGDIGRSPRMNYHCLSLASEGYQVTLIGYRESKTMSEIEENSNIRIISLINFPKFLQIGPKLVQYMLKVTFLSVTLGLSLFQITIIPNFILVQNPPSIPTLLISYLYVKIANSKLIIDWHNYGFTILSLSTRSDHPLVKICKMMEILFGRLSDYNLCVTNAMREDLLKNEIKSKTLYDKPHERFQPLTLEAKHLFFIKLAQNYDLNDFLLLTEEKDGQIVLRKNRSALVVSCSSWTDDEDFHVLLEALKKYQLEISGLPNIVCILTGKGPNRNYYEEKFKAEHFENIIIKFLWLDSQYYPYLLGAADLGISLHKSSSDLDLPMKVVDMFGTSLPVCALRFKCVGELVKDKEYGELFDDSNELFLALKKLLINLDNNSILRQYRVNLNEFQKRRWKDEWTEVMKDIL